MKHAVIIGAGPMGLEAALGALARGFAVTVLERGRVGENLRRWGSTRFFSPFGMNASPRLRALLGSEAPAPEALLSGPEMAERVLEPVAATPPLIGRVRTGHRVLAVGRKHLLRRDLPGHPLRAERGFRVLVESEGREEMIEADVVLDASGVYDRPVALGTGGIPAPGEATCAEGLIRDLGALDARLPALADRDVLLVGHGHSAANALALLQALPRPPRVTWATRSAHRRPCVEIANDPLPERERVTRAANDQAATPPERLTVERRATVEAIVPERGRLTVRLSGGRAGTYDAVVGMTGYRPDLSFVSELALEVSPVSEGAARLSRALAHTTDCLTPPVLAEHDLESGEPGFHLVGAKSYGRLPTFLLQNGRQQLERILDGLAARA